MVNKMITPERVYEVFNLGHKWKTVTLNRNQLLIQSNEEQICDCGHSNNIRSLQLARVLKSFPEMLVALVNIAIEMEPYHNRKLEDKGLYILAIKAIESADSKDREWPELLKELRK